MAGIWVRSGTIALTSGSKKVTGTGTSWNSGLNKVTKGCALKHNNIDYEVDYVNSDTELYLVDTYAGATLSGQAYRIQVAITDTIPELSSRIAQALAYWNGQAGNLQLMMSGSGNVTLTFPDGTQVTIPAWGNMQPKDGLLTAIAALTTSADKLFYATGADAVAMTTLSAKGRELIDDADSSAMLTTLGVSTFIKSLLDDTDAAAALGTLGITKASLAETNSRLAADRVVTPAGLNAVVPYAPTINPTLDLDFAKQKYRWYAGASGLTESSTPSLMTFTRSSIATYFDAMGVMKQAAVDTPRINYDPATGECKGLLIEESRTNLLTYSKSVAGWASDSSTSPESINNAGLNIDGTLTAWMIPLNATSRNQRNYTITADTNSYTFSCYVKALQANAIVNFGPCGIGGVSTSISTFTFATATLSGGAGSSVTNAGNGWYKISRTYVNNGSGTVFIVNVLADPLTNGMVLFGPAQLEVGAFPTSYIQSAETWTARASTATYLDANGVVQTAASGVARSNAYDYDSDGVLRPIGLLLESAATNLLLYSEQLDNAIWTKTNVTITANATTAPDGTITADKITESASTGIHEVTQAFSISTDTYVSAKILLKKAERNYAVIRLSGNSKRAACVVDLTTGAYTVTNWNNTLNTSVSVTLRPDGWVRVVLTSLSNYATTPGWNLIMVSPADSFVDATSVAGSGYSYTGDGTSGIYMWAAQVENNKYATSYIQTTSAQVTRVADKSTSAQATRAADIALITQANTSLWINSREGSLVSISDSNYIAGSGVTASSVCSLDDGTTNNRISLFAAGSVTLTEIVTGGVAQASLQQAGVSVGVKRKAALGYAKDSFVSSADGSASVSDTSGTVPNVKQLRLGKILSGGQLNGHIRSLKYYPKALSSTELQAMTA